MSKSVYMMKVQAWLLSKYVLDRDDPPKHFFRRTAINSPHCQEFMVWRIISVVLIFMDPLMDEFTL